MSRKFFQSVTSFPLLAPVCAAAMFAASVCHAPFAHSAQSEQSIPGMHGPICIWHGDPTSEMILQWIERESQPSDVWFPARAGWGYGDNDDTTELDMAGRSTALYARTTFSVESPDELEKLVLRVRYDDGFVAYLNGVEVLRVGVDAATGKVDSHEAGDEPEAFDLSPMLDGVIQEGVNVLALEGHNTSLTSSDFTLDPALVGTLEGEAVDLVPRGAEWLIRLGAAPAPDWTTAAEVSSTDRSDADAQWQVQYRAADESQWHDAEVRHRPFADTTSRIGASHLTGLNPGERYEVRIRGVRQGETLWDRSVQFETAPESLEEDFSFVTGGDMYHRRELLDAMNRRAGALDPMFALLGGDLAYANARIASRWYDWVDSWYECAVTPDGCQVPMIAVIGNHETSGPDPKDAKFYYSLFPLPEDRSNFVIDFGDSMTLVCLDSDHTQRVAAQTEWLEATLEQRKDWPLVFVCYHRPTYGTGVKSDNLAIRTEWCPLFERYQVDAVFENDHHVYKRTAPIRDGQVDEESGIVYLGDGAWGVGVRDIPEDQGENLPYMERAESLNHLIHVRVTEETIHYDAVTADGEVFDQYQRTR